MSLQRGNGRGGRGELPEISRTLSRRLLGAFSESAAPNRAVGLRPALACIEVILSGGATRIAFAEWRACPPTGSARRRVAPFMRARARDRRGRGAQKLAPPMGASAPWRFSSEVGPARVKKNATPRHPEPIPRSGNGSKGCAGTAPASGSARARCRRARGGPSGPRRARPPRAAAPPPGRSPDA